MSILTSAYAFKMGSDLILSFKVWDADTTEIKWSKTVSLPKDQALFTNVHNELYGESVSSPSYITKQSFKRDFIDYTLSLSIDNLTPPKISELNLYYENLFMLEQHKAIEDTSNNVQNVLDKLVSEYNQGVQENQEKYAETTSDLEEEPNPDNNEGNDDDENLENSFPTTVAGPEDISVNQAPDFPQPQAAGTKPPTSDSRPVRTMAGTTLQTAAGMANLPPGVLNTLNGLGGDRLIEPVPEPLFYPGDAHMEGENNAGIIFSRDELYRQRGHTKSGAVYLYAGRSPNNVQTAAIDGSGNSTGVALKKPNDLVRDSAYLYISQKSDTDNLLRVAGGTYARAVGGTSPRQGQSLAAMKADNIVLIARESGIRLITGTDKTNSRNGEQYAKFGIDLIAGNDDSNLQPLVKGLNLQKYLEGLSKSVDELRAVVYKFITSQTDYNAALLDHQHYDPFSIWLGSMAFQNPGAINDGQTWFSPEVVQAGAKVLLESAQLQANTISQMRNRINNDSNAFDKLGSYKILSEKNRTN